MKKHQLACKACACVAVDRYFGMGYLSLGVLKTSPADVKIDRAFIRDIQMSTFMPHVHRSCGIGARRRGYQRAGRLKAWETNEE